MIARTLRLAAALLPLTLPGCAVWSFMLGSPRIHDLRFESIEVTDRRDHPESWLSRDSPPPQPAPALLVRFSTAHDLARVFANGGHSVWADISLCTDARFDGDRLLTGIPSVHTAAGDVMTADLDPAPLPRRADGRIVYSFFPDIVSQAEKRTINRKPDPRYVSHDLRRDPADLCFRLRGGTMAFTSYTSNTAIIPADALRAAFARATPPATP
ncbi:hypothetical protein [Roseomonas gilardii]|uniref:hypothetical protein n=1 Tax=Roseomonas gilardii TaxID=257708 RepID=UPI00119F45DA|nr:hypothetical protein [Roseomonas gilardii]